MNILDVPQSGSIGGVTSSRNRTGQYRRTRAIPTQPRTAAQLNQRARLSDMSASWRGLSAANLAAWNAFGLSFTITNRLGQSINLTGHQCYVKVNTVNLLIGDAAVSIPPALPAFVAATVTALTGVAATPALKLAGTSPAAGTKFMVYASPQKSAGVSFNGTFGYMQTFTAATGGFFDITTVYTAKYGSLIVGKKIFVKVVQSQAGMQDSGTLFSAVVT